MKVKFLFAAAALSLGVAAHADISSTFDFSAEGWLGVNVSFPGLTLLGTNNPVWTGHSITDQEFQGGGLYLFAAPAKFTGNLSSYYGGTVSYQLSDAVADGVPYPNLILQGAGQVLYYTTPAPGTTLTSYSIGLTPTGWLKGSGGAPSEAEFKAVLSSVDVFAINADWKTAGTDSNELDNVLVHAVPEPMSFAVLGLGLLGLVRRRRNA